MYILHVTEGGRSTKSSSEKQLSLNSLDPTKLARMAALV